MKKIILRPLVILSAFVALALLILIVKPRAERFERIIESSGEYYTDEEINAAMDVIEHKAYIFVKEDWFVDEEDKKIIYKDPNQYIDMSYESIRSRYRVDDVIMVKSYCYEFYLGRRNGGQWEYLTCGKG